MSGKQNLKAKTAELANSFWEFNENTRHDIAIILLSESLRLHGLQFERQAINKGSDYHGKEFMRASARYIDMFKT